MNNKKMTRELPEKIKRNSNFAFFCLLLYSIALFIRPQDWASSVDGSPTPIARYFLIAAFAGYLIFQEQKIWGYQGWFLFLLLLIIPVSGLRNGWFGGGINEAIDFFIQCLIPYLLYSGLVNTQRKQHWVLIILALASATMLHHGISQTLSPEGIAWSGMQSFRGGRIRFLGFFNDPNDLGMFFVMNIPLLMYLKTLTQSRILKLVFFILTLGLLYGIYLTNSRGALLGAMSLIVTFFYFQYGKIKFFSLSLFFAPIAYYAMSMFRTIDSDESSAAGRVNAWYSGIQMFKSRPLLGVGKGQFVEHHYLTAHNSYVLVMAELGILGYIFWLTSIALSLSMLITIFNLSKEKYKDNPELLLDILFAKCLFFSFVGFMTTAFFLSRSYIIYLYVFIGFVSALYFRVLQSAPEISVVTNPKNMTSLLMIVISSLIGLYLFTIFLL